MSGARSGSPACTCAVVPLWESLSNLKLPELTTTPRRPQGDPAVGEVQQLRQPRRRFGADEAAELVARYEAGGTIRGLARELGVPRELARRILSDAGVTRRKRASLTPSDLAMAVELYEGGVSIQQVA